MVLDFVGLLLDTRRGPRVDGTQECPELGETVAR